MNLTGGEIAGLIAAIAFAVVAIALAIAIFKAGGVISELNHTVEEINKTITVVTKNSDHLLIEVEGLLNKSNTTLDDVNGKLGLTDPLFKAVGDLGVSVSDLNNSTRNLTTQISGKAKPGSTFGLSRKVGERVTKL